MSGINLSNIGPNTTVNIVTGQQTCSQVGQGNIQSSGIDCQQLQNLLELLKKSAETAADVSKQDYAGVVQAAKEIESEIKKKEGADKSVLAKAKDVLAGFKDIASIAGHIENISQMLLPLLG